jgi:hypothetical protein
MFSYLKLTKCFYIITQPGRLFSNSEIEQENTSGLDELISNH